MVPRATIDFESRSACSLKLAGTWRYSIDPTTEILCLAYRLPTWPEGVTALWHPATTDYQQYLSELLDWVLAGKLIEAHNAWFERCMWQNILVPVHGFPLIQPQQWRCSAAKAAAHALPRGLDEALAALKLPIRKDAEGEKVMKKMSKPRKPRKAEREAWEKAHGNIDYPRLYWEDDSLLQKLFAYCRQDVLAEDALSNVLADLSEVETRVYLLDQLINERGFLLDHEAVETALSMIADEQARGLVELAVLTGGKVKKATQRAQMLRWLEGEGVRLPNTQRETLEETLSNSSFGTFEVAARRGIELMLTLGKSSTAKYTAMQNQMSPVDHRVRGGLLYHGASTGRWSGSGVQPHNFPKGKIKGDEMEDVWELMKYQDRDAWLIQGSNVLETLSGALRGVIIPSVGHQLYVADYSGIEARVLLWLANDQKGLELFRQNKDIYLDMAMSIYERPLTKDDKDERALGKVAVLGLGYQMGPAKFVDTVAHMAGLTISDELAQQTVDAYRAKYHLVKQEWYDQEAAAKRAVRGGVHDCGRVSWFVEKPFLYCELPSGRCLAYPFPKVQERETSWGELKPTLTFMGVNPYNHQWQRQHTYGGMLVENIVQAIARDLMAAALLRCEASGIYVPVLSVHDEVIAEAKVGAGTVSAFEELIAECPEWAHGCPVNAEGWRGMRYHK